MITDYEQYFKQYKKSMVGKEDYIFLVNDTSNEIRQHYDRNYDGITFDQEKFTQQLNNKRQYLEKMNSKYEFFVIPDKSIMLRQYLPFDTQEPTRCIDLIDEQINNLDEYLNENDYQKDDTHISELAAIKIVSAILNKLHPERTREQYSRQLLQLTDKQKYDAVGDLLFPINWGYGKDHQLFKKYYHANKERFIPKNTIQNINIKIPEQYKKMGKRESQYYYNENSITDKRALILRDSTTDQFRDVLSLYYREVFYYWDHWYFNKDLIDWYRPDEVIEIRTERFIANPIEYEDEEPSPEDETIIITPDENLLSQLRNNNRELKNKNEELYQVINNKNNEMIRINNQIKEIRHENEKLERQNQLLNGFAQEKDTLISKLRENNQELKDKSEELYQVIRDKNEDIKDINRRQRQLEEQNKKLEIENEKIRNSTSWKMTKPLRKIRKILGR
ncbi:MAG: hypothetical protein BZ136_01325 [Methanosphaera sp. rholeuAM74]|nr:MAG: hypothetical protein BZ136_01325 [Methanosphaera sp. rholeuAM74]